MARVTVEDCVEKVPNRFDLVMLAAQRSRDIATGSQLTVERDNDKNPVVALREIADETIDIDTVKDSLIRGLQKYVDNDEPEVEDEMEKVVSSLTESGIDLDDFSSVDAGGDSAQRFEDVDADDLED